MSASTVEGLKRALGEGQVVTDPALLGARRHDYWMVSHLRDRRGTPAPAPACVVRPRSASDVQAAVRYAGAHGVPVIPFGLGSGVVGGIIARADAIVIDLSAMARVRSIDPVNLLASFDAGKNGAEAEAAVAEQGLTIGHWPQSVAVSSVGGWVATRASGQFSTANGNIEDIVHTIEAVLPSGELVTLGKGPRASAGPDLRHLMMGSEGTLGVITGVTFSVRRTAEARALSAFEVEGMQRGFDLQREIVQRGWRPPVMRQYDERESRRLDGRLSRCAILMVHEGPAALVAAETGAVAALAAEMGATPAPAEIVEHWLEHRNNVPPWDSILERNMVADTVEVSADWNAIGKVYNDAVAGLKQIPGCLAASAHSSHVYRSGLNLYFTFAVLPHDLAEMEQAYFEAWARIIDATDRHGGSLSHHHGIGRVRRDAGTTTARVCLFSLDGDLAARAAAPVRSTTPGQGRVEQDAEAIWRTVRRLIAAALAAGGVTAADVVAIGITTQRTSLVAWERKTGRALAPMVVWSDLRGTRRAEELQAVGYMVAPQQAATKLEALLDAIPTGRAMAAEAGLAVGNIDAFLVWKLTGGSSHVTDRSQAWPLGYLDLGSMGWNRSLLDLQGVDEAILPRLVDTWGRLATTSRSVFGAVVPIAAIIADQQAALVGHGADAAGEVKVTYGTSATLGLGTGGAFVFKGAATPPFVVSHVAGETCFCLEGMVFAAGSAVDWLRRTMRVSSHAAFEALAAAAREAGGAAFLPALHGLGAPHSDPGRRGLLSGLSGVTGRAEIARAALEGVGFRVREILDHLTADDGRPALLKADGGLAASDVLMQLQADVTGVPVARHALRDAAAAGAAIAAGRGVGVLGETAGFTRHDRLFEPAISADEADERFAAWRALVYP